MSSVRRGTVLSFDSTAWTAQVLLEGADQEAQLPVGQWVQSAQMAASAEVAVLAFDPTNSDDGVVLGAYGAVSQWNFPAINAAANGQLLIGNGTGMVLATITGTANQVIVTNGAGTIALAGPQDLAAASSPTFAALTITGAVTAGGTVQGGVLKGIVSDAGTTNQPTPLQVSHFSSQPAAVGFGVSNVVTLHSASNVERTAANVVTTWGTALDASYKARQQYFIYDSGGSREFLRGEASGSVAMVGFLGAAAVARAAAYTQTFSTASRTVSAATASAPPAGGTGVAAGAYDTSAHRDAMITSLTNVIADVAVLRQLINSLIDDSQALGFAS